jgi:putative ABC transport system permease protein
MNILLKNTIKNIWQRKLQVFSTIALIILGTSQFIAMQQTVSNINLNINEYETTYNREDARILVKPEIDKEDVLNIYGENNVSKEDIVKNDFNTNKEKYNISLKKYEDEEVQKLSQKYDFKYELESSKISEFDTNQYVRYMIDPQEINKNVMTSGVKPKNSDEIMLSERYGTLRKIEIGQTFKGINNKEYKITGFFRSPAYSIVINNPTNKLPDSQNELLAVVTPDEFDRINIKQSSAYTLKFITPPANINDTIEEMREEENIIFLLDKDNNTVLNILDIRRDLVQKISLIIPPVLIAISMLIFITLIRKQIDGQRRQIGVLKALGYSSNKILLPYISLPIIVLLISLPIGLILGVGLSKVFINQLAETSQLQPVAAELDIKLLLSILIGTIITFEVIVIASVRNKLKKPAINLLHDSASARVNPMTRLTEKIFRKTKFETRLRALNTSQSFVKIISILFLGIITSLLMLVSLGINSVFTSSKNKIDNNKYEYKVLLKKSYEENEIDKKDNPQLINNERVKLEKVNDTKINTIVGFNRTDTTNLYQSYDSEKFKGEQQYDNGIVINQTISALYDIKTDDIITVEIDGKTKELKVLDINRSDGETPSITTSYKFAKDNLEIDNKLVNKYYLENSAPEPNINQDDKIKSVTTKSEEIEGINKTQKSTQTIFTMIFLIVGLFVFVIFTLVASFIIEDNRRNIAMMQVIGYNDRKIQKLILNIYFPVLIIGLIIGTLLSFSANAELQTFFTKLVRQDMPIQNNLSNYIIVFAYILGIYIFSMILSRKKVKKIDIKEIMS